MERKRRKVYRYELERVLKEEGAETRDQVLDVLFGNYNNDYDTDYLVQDRWWDAPKLTKWNRFNRIWVGAVFWISFPVRYVICDSPYIDKETKLGKIVYKLVGED